MIKTLKDEGQFHFDLFDSMNLLRKFIGDKDGACIPCELSYILKQDVSNNTHNCLGCSFNKIFNNAYRVIYEHVTLSMSPTHGHKINREFVLYNCFHWLNLAVEQIKYIREVLESKGLDSKALDTDKYFDGLHQVNKITNLFKHPKVFAFTHHLEYIFEYETPNLGKYQKVEFSEVYEYFCGKKLTNEKKLELFETYKNKIIAIELPSLKKLIGDFLSDFTKILLVISKSEDYIVVLSNESNL